MGIQVEDADLSYIKLKYWPVEATDEYVSRFNVTERGMLLSLLMCHFHPDWDHSHCQGDDRITYMLGKALEKGGEASHAYVFGLVTGIKLRYTLTDSFNKLKYFPVTSPINEWIETLPEGVITAAYLKLYKNSSIAERGDTFLIKARMQILLSSTAESERAWAEEAIMIALREMV